MFISKWSVSDSTTLLPVSDVGDRARAIHDAALEAARGFRRAEAALIDALIEVDRERVYRDLGFASMYAYATQALGLSEAVACNAVTVAKKSREIPALRDEIASGSISISKARKITPVLKAENQSEWLDRARTLTSRQLEKEVARENPRAAAPERVRYVSGKRVEMSVGMDEARVLRLRRAQDRVSQARGRAVSLEETMDELVDFYLKHKDPLEKAKRVVAKKGSNVTVAKRTGSVKSVPGQKRASVPAAIEHEVRLRDHDRCQFRRADGAVCGERRWIDLHHILPVSEGGPNTVENLVTLCLSHHRSVHEK